MAGWTPTEFGTAEQFQRVGEFYSHQYDAQGEKDVLAAAKDYIERSTEGTVTKLALHLLEHEGASTDWYHMGGSERWYVDCEPHISLARELLELVIEV